jgi:succinyl-CoA synthetase beta subunit
MPAPSSRATPDRSLHRLLEKAAPGTALSEAESAAVLGHAGIPVAAHRVVDNLEQAVAAAVSLGFPVVVKALAPGIAHKNQMGLIRTGVANSEDLTAAFGELDVRLRDNGFDPDVVPRLVQSMVKADLELIAGISHEPPLGHFLLVGVGGINTEIFDEVILLPIPATRSAIENRVGDSRLGRLLDRIGALGHVADVLDSLQSLALDAPELIESVDVNPVLVTGNECVAVDALVVRPTDSGGTGTN